MTEDSTSRYLLAAFPKASIYWMELSWPCVPWYLRIAAKRCPLCPTHPPRGLDGSL